MFLSWSITHQKVSLERKTMITFCSTDYRLEFDEQSKFPTILESIKVDTNLHGQLQFNGNTVPLPPWFISGHQYNAKLTRVSMLENLLAYFRSVASDSPFSLIDELNEIIKREAHLLILQLCSDLHFTSDTHHYKLIRCCLKNFLCPLFPFLIKFSGGGVDAIKGLKKLRDM